MARLLAITAFLLAISVPALADPFSLHIISGSSWKSSATLIPGWQDPSFDDSSWVPARANYPYLPPFSPDHEIPGTTATFMWYDPNNTSNGEDGALDTYYRYTFTMSLTAADLPLLGQALINVDDAYKFYVNGMFVKEDIFASNVDLLDFTQYLVNGRNVLAIEAADGGFPPYERAWEKVLFDGRVETVMPEPAAVVLLATASLLVLRGLRSRARRH